MRSFLWATGAALISGILLLVIQRVTTGSADYEIRWNAEAQSISLGSEELDKLKPDNEYDRRAVNFTAVTVENTGNAPLVNQSVKIVKEYGGDILVFSQIELPASDVDSIDYIIKDGELLIKYRLLNPSERHVFWVAYRGGGGIKFYARAPGLMVVENSD